MRRVTNFLIVASVMAASGGTRAAGEDIGNNPGSFTDALQNGRMVLDLRPRYNQIDESNKPLRTEGITMRIVAGWRTAPYQGWRLLVEGIRSQHIGPEDFNDDGSRFGTSPYPLLPDPEHTGMNQVLAEGEAAPGLRLKLGRQVMHLDNQRWVSDNDFRQIPQLFDGATATYAAGESAELLASWFGRVRDTSGDTNRLKLTLLRGAWNPLPGHSLAAYAIFHDQASNGANTGFADSSYRVTGLRADGAFGNLPGFSLPYILEVAQQRDFAGGDTRIHGNYWRAGGGAEGAWWTVRYDYEVKGSNNGVYGVQMPLTNFYIYNGWSLHFFNTPRTGLRDSWLTARCTMGAFTLYAEAHRFRSDFNRLDYGKETDLGITWQLHPDANLRLQHARYDPGRDGTGATVRKTWLTLSYSY